MKKLLPITLIIFIIVCSCDIEKRKQKKLNIEREIQLRKEEIRKETEKRIAEEQKAKQIQDSITILEQSKVIGEVCFGMSKYVAKQKINKFINHSKRTKYTNSDMKYCFIGNYEFNEFGVDDYYYENKLYKLVIEGDYVKWDDYEADFEKQTNFIYNVIKQKYGTPSFSKKIPKRYEIDKGYTYQIYAWDIGTKRIEIRVKEKGLYYTTDVYIYQTNIQQAVIKNRRLAEKAKTQEAKNVF